jgi:hypothetical protein
MRYSCCFRIEKSKKTDRKPSQKRKKNAKMSKSISAEMHPFQLCRPEFKQRNERAQSFCTSRLLAAAAIPTSLAGIAAVTLGVGGFGVIVEK